MSSPRLVEGMKPALPPGPCSCPVCWGCGHMSLCGCSPLMTAGDTVAAKRYHFLQEGFYGGWGGGRAFTEPCLHFWSFLRDTLSRAMSRPAWSHLLPGGLRGRHPLFKHFSYVACAPPGWRA